MLKKSQMIYHYIRTHKSVSKQDIVIGLKLSLPTVTQNLQYLEGLGLIDTSKKIENTGGRNATAYSYKERARTSIGVSLTGHHIGAVAIDLSGAVITMRRESIEFNLGDEDYLKKIGEVVEEIKSEANISDDNLLGVGVAVPGLMSDDGEVVKYGLTLNFTGRTRKEICKYIRYHNRLFHDSSTAGYAEVWILRDRSNAFYLSLSNSVGGAVLINKEIYDGNVYKSGEVGHMTVVPKDGELCYCGQYGCFDTVCRSTILDQYADGNLESFFQLLEKGDEGALKLWDTYLDNLALGINNIRMLFDSDIIIGGYVGAYIGDCMEDLCRKVDARNPFSEKSSEYLFPCKYKIESTAAGTAIHFVDDFFDTI